MLKENLQIQLSELAGAVKALKTMTEADLRFQFLSSVGRKAIKTTNLSLAFQAIKTTREEVASKVKEQGFTSLNLEEDRNKTTNLIQQDQISLNLSELILDKKAEELNQKEIEIWLNKKREELFGVNNNGVFINDTSNNSIDFILGFGTDSIDPISEAQLYIFEEYVTVNNIKKIELLKTELDQIMDACYRNIPLLNEIINKYNNEVYKIESNNSDFAKIWKKIKPTKISETRITMQNLISYTIYFQHSVKFLQKIKNIIENRTQFDEGFLSFDSQPYYYLNCKDFRSNLFVKELSIKVNDFEPFKIVKYSELPEYASLLLQTTKDVEIRIKHELEDSQKN
jgi:hypothetical protein